MPAEDGPPVPVKLLKLFGEVFLCGGRQFSVVALIQVKQLKPALLVKLVLEEGVLNLFFPVQPAYLKKAMLNRIMNRAV